MNENPFSRAALLAPVRYWTPRRKRLLVVAVSRRIVGFEEVGAAHRISAEEFAEWRGALRALGPRGLTASAPVLLRRASERDREERGA